LRPRHSYAAKFVTLASGAPSVAAIGATSSRSPVCDRLRG
jgi:hypothetical protein